MPIFTGTKLNGQIIFDDWQLREKYISKLAQGQRFRENLTKAGGAKSNPQLGYYYGLLLPEIHKQYLSMGFTVSMPVVSLRQAGKPIVVERKPTEDDTHQAVKDICARVGDNGERMDCGDMDDRQMSKFIDHVLYHATWDLGMDGDKLAARRPEASK